MSVFKMIRGEFKKIFSRPLVFVMIGILAALLVVSNFIYNPKDRVLSTDSLVFTGNTVNELRDQFTDLAEVPATASFNKAQEILNFYQNNYDKIISLNPADNQAAKTIESTFLDLHNVLDTYNKYKTESDMAHNSLRLPELNIKLDQVKTELTLFKNNLAALMDNKTVNNYPAPLVLGLLKDVDSLILDDSTHTSLVNTIIGLLDSLPPAPTTSYVHHADIIGKIEKGKYFKQITDTLNKLKDVSISESVFDEASAFFGVYDERQTVLKTQIYAAGVTTDQIISLAKQYKFNEVCLQQLVYVKLYAEAIKDIDDENIAKLHTFNTNIYVGADITTSLYKYGISDDIAFYTYLWDNKMTDTDIFFNFSSGYIMGEKKSAFDYAFFAMEFMGFFVVLMIAILGATMIAGEYEGGTIKVLAIRPYRRDKIISGKLFATIMFSFIFIMFLGLTSIIIGSIMHGGLDLSKNILAVFGGKALELNPIVMFLIYLLTLFVKTLIFLCPAFLISVCFKSNLGAILFTILIYLLGPFCALFAGNSTFTTFLPFVNIDFYKFTGGEYSALYHETRNMLATPAMPNNHPLIVLMLALVVVSTTLVATYYVFKKRDIH